jgi:hypothetical protein
MEVIEIHNKIMIRNPEIPDSQSSAPCSITYIDREFYALQSRMRAQPLQSGLHRAKKTVRFMH